MFNLFRVTYTCMTMMTAMSTLLEKYHYSDLAWMLKYTFLKAIHLRLREWQSKCIYAIQRSKWTHIIYSTLEGPPKTRNCQLRIIWVVICTGGYCTSDIFLLSILRVEWFWYSCLLLRGNTVCSHDLMIVIYALCFEVEDCM